MIASQQIEQTKKPQLNKTWARMKIDQEHKRQLKKTQKK